jgi:hypothetical protein
MCKQGKANIIGIGECFRLTDSAIAYNGLGWYKFHGGDDSDHVGRTEGIKTSEDLMTGVLSSLI